MRTLTELIDEAEGAISSPLKNKRVSASLKLSAQRWISESVTHWKVAGRSSPLISHEVSAQFCFGLLQIHPEVPKKPPPANAMFVEENWAKLRKKHPKMATKHLLKLIHQNYKELSDNEKVSLAKG